jgi:hypothetical protein
LGWTTRARRHGSLRAMPLKQSILPVLAVAGALLIPTTAHAATTVGGDPSQGDPAHMVRCPDECTITLDRLGGAPVIVPGGTVITHWSGYFEADAMVGLRLMKRNADGTFTSDGESGYVYAAGGAEGFDTHVEVPEGDHAIALDLHYGAAAGARADAGARTFTADQILWNGDTARGTEAAQALQLNVTYDVPGTTPDPSSTPPDEGGPILPPSTPSEPSPGDAPKGLSFDARGVLSPDGRHVSVYARNETEQPLAGPIRLKVGHKLFKTARASDFDYHSSEDFDLPLSGKPLKKLLRKGTLKATIVAKLKGRDGGVSKTAKVKIVRGGAKGYDGTYRGKGPLVIVVKRGVITAISEPMNTYCSANGKFVMRSMMTGLGFPALIAKDGSFDHKASFSSDTFTYRGKLNRDGSASGYLSLWYSFLDLSPEGRFRAVQCVQADNWTAKRK